MIGEGVLALEELPKTVAKPVRRSYSAFKEAMSARRDVDQQ